jgi:hypothetical protein
MAVTAKTRSVKPHPLGDCAAITCRATGVGMLLADLLTCIGHQQSLGDVRGFVHRGWNGLDGKGAELVGESYAQKLVTA